MRTWWWWLVVVLVVLAAAVVEKASSQETFTPVNSYFVNCGSPNSSNVESQLWLSDSSSAHFLSSSSQILASTTNVSSSLSPLLSTARIFTVPTSYSFPVAPFGRLWIRLYFYPFPYQQFDPSSALFSVSAGAFTLLFNLNVTDAISSAPESSAYLYKEFSVNSTSSSLLITFTPSETNGSYAFVNALEVVSMPPTLISDDASPLGTNAVTPTGLPDMALETMYRINVGGPLVSSSNDSTGLYRTWLPGESFLRSSAGVEPYNTSKDAIIYTQSDTEIFAPPDVYSTALQMSYPQPGHPNSLNLSWVFPVDADYQYVVRLHFCELVYGSGGKRVFDVYLQNQTSFSNLDLGKVYGQNTPFFADFSLVVRSDESLWIQAGPPPSSDADIFNQAIVNGIEIWKVNNSQGSLDGRGIGGVAPTRESKTKVGPVLGALVGILAASGLLLAGICYVCRRRAKIIKQPTAAWIRLPMHGGLSVSLASKTSTASLKSGAGSYASSAPSSLGRLFTFSEIMEATHNFDEALVLGVGGFGKVYQGELDDGTKLAVKRGNPRSEQGIMEFQTEIDMLSKLRHRHLVSLIGYCNEHQEMILVYEYMANGTLRSHLYGSDLPPLSWRQRLEICIGAARGLHYLHTGAAQSIIHRDVKTTNILLDENFMAKVSDFGLSKTGPSLDRTHVSTAVKGSFGYLDPEYFRRQQLTDKSDVYSLGVVLMEVLCARPAINPALPRDQVNIAEWTMHWQGLGRLDQIIDPHLAGTINERSLAKFGEVAEKCLADEGINRPTMGDALWNLEYALQLQETATSDIASENSRSQIRDLPLLVPAEVPWDESIVSHSNVDLEDATVSAVFSNMVKPHKR